MIKMQLKKTQKYSREKRDKKYRAFLIFFAKTRTKKYFFCILYMYNLKGGVVVTKEIAELQEIIDNHDNIVFFGGAGVSTESGIPDFRSKGGLYNQKYKYPPETILSNMFFYRRPEEFFRFYRDKMICDTAKPNAAHLKLAELEHAGKVKAIVTQNIDGLHQMAGSENVLELHGSIYRNHCKKCGREYGLDAVKNSEGVPKCECGGIIKPDVVLYGENLNDDVMNRAAKAINEAQVLIVGGTSLSVWPAASLIDYFRGNHLIVINKTQAERDSFADLVIREPIGEVFSQIVAKK